MGLFDLLGITKKKPKLESGYHYLKAALELIAVEEMEQAYEYLIIASEKGYDSAYVHLGWMFLYGIYVEKDFQMAEELFVKAAKAGEAAAYYYLALMVIGEQSNIADENTALEMLQFAADEGVDAAQLWIAEMYFTGEGLPLDHIKAKFYTQRAAINGNKDAVKFYNDNKNAFNSVPDINVDKKESKWASKSGATFSSSTIDDKDVNINKSTQKSKFQADNIPSSQKICATCSFWGGQREIKPDGHNLKVQRNDSGYSEGRCIHQDFLRANIYRRHLYVCAKFEKWSPLK